VNEFGNNVERHRRELLVHCYRMLFKFRAPRGFWPLVNDGEGVVPVWVS